MKETTRSLFEGLNCGAEKRKKKAIGYREEIWRRISIDKTGGRCIWLHPKEKEGKIDRNFTNLTFEFLMVVFKTKIQIPKQFQAHWQQLLVQGSAQSWKDGPY